MKKFIAYFFNGNENDMDADMVHAEIINAPTKAMAEADALEILKRNPKYLSYGVYSTTDDVLNLNCHCAIDNKDSYMPLRDAIKWFNQMVFEGNTRIRVWTLLEGYDEEDLIMYSGGLPM